MGFWRPVPSVDLRRGLSAMSEKEFDEGVIRRDFQSALDNLKDSDLGQSFTDEDVRELKSWLDKQLEEIIVERR